MKQNLQDSFSEDGLSRLKLYSELLLKWNKSINLISKTTEKDVWNRHIKDSAQLKKYIKPGTKKILDVGSGAGFPAMVLAILCPDIEVAMVESDAKKCAFLSNVSRETKTPVKIICSRLEALNPIGADIITARAFASVEKIFDLCASQISSQTEFLLLKGGRVEEELANARKMWKFESALYPSEIDESGVVLHIYGEFECVAK